MKLAEILPLLDYHNGFTVKLFDERCGYYEVNHAEDYEDKEVVRIEASSCGFRCVEVYVK